MKEKSQETRFQILIAAESLFAQLGYDATGVAEICSSAGVSKGAFYHHFESKQAVFLALLDQWMLQIDQSLKNARDLSGDVPEALITMAGMTDKIFKGHFPLFLEFWIQASRHPEIWQSAIAPYHRYQEYFTGIIDEGINEGSFSNDINSTSAGQIIVALAMGLLLQAFFDPEGAAWEHVAQDALTMLIKGLERRTL